MTFDTRSGTNHNSEKKKETIIWALGENHLRGMERFVFRNEQWNGDERRRMEFLTQALRGAAALAQR